MLQQKEKKLKTCSILDDDAATATATATATDDIDNAKFQSSIVAVPATITALEICVDMLSKEEDILNIPSIRKILSNKKVTAPEIHACGYAIKRESYFKHLDNAIEGGSKFECCGYY